MPYFPNNVHNKSSNKMSSNTSLDNTSDQDYSEFLSEYLLQTNSPSHEPEIHYEEGEMEAEWLIAAGFPQLTKPFEQGLELRTSELEPILATLSKPHAEAIKQRVRALNHTVRGRTKNRQNRKPDIRDVFRDVDESSTGTRSRSATPDSLDSIHGDADEVWGNASIPSFVSIFDHHTNATDRDDNPLSLQLGKQLKQRLRRTPSAPLKGATDIFRGSHVRCDIPMDSADGIELLGFSRIGTLHLPRNRSGSDPAVSLGRSHGQVMQQDSHSDNNTLSSDSSDECLSNTGARLSNLSNPESSPQNILNKINLDTPPQSVQNSPSRDCISFSNMIRESSSQDGVDTIDGSDSSLEICSDIDTMNETDLKRLQPIFWLELASIFDRNHVTFDKRKPFKRRRKEEGNLFGVSLNALIRRDQQIIGTDSTLVPIFLECLLEQLIIRGSREVGILRIAGHKQKTELLYAELESSFYQKPKKFAQIFATTNVHDLCALLKRWLRELPQPLLSSELIQLFYQCHALPPSDQSKALSIICQMLPHENRNTLRRLLRFFNSVIENKELNKMNEHNVATMIAPSLFPPRYIHPRNKNSIEEQVQMAAHCCRLTNTLITRGELLFQVPNNLIEESKLTNKTRQGKRGMHRRVKATTSLLHVTNNNNNNISNNNNNNNKNNNLSKNSATTVAAAAAAATTAANIVVITSNNAAGGVSAGGVGNVMGTNTKTLLSRQQSVNPSHVHRLII